MNASILPLWENAVLEFMKLNPKPGMVIDREWLDRQFGIEPPESIEEYKQNQLRFLSAFDDFRNCLLRDHLIDLRALRGAGYEVIAPNQQTEIALNVGARNISKELRKMARSIAYVDVAQLNEPERKVHTDGLAKASSLRLMFNRRQILGRN